VPPATGRRIIRRISEAILGPHKLFDMSAHAALPCGGAPRQRTEAGTATSIFSTGSARAAASRGRDRDGGGGFEGNDPPLGHAVAVPAAASGRRPRRSSTRVPGVTVTAPGGYRVEQLTPTQAVELLRGSHNRLDADAAGLGLCRAGRSPRYDGLAALVTAKLGRHPVSGHLSPSRIARGIKAHSAYRQRMRSFGSPGIRCTTRACARAAGEA
jgi:hypothetical protein